MDGLFDEVNETPLDKVLFTELSDIADEALAGKRRAFPPDIERFLDGKPRPGTLALTDVPENQMGLAVAQECRRRFDRERAQAVGYSFLMRFSALRKMRTAGKLTEWVTPVGDGMVSIHTAILDAAAIMPIQPDGLFGDDYLAKVREIVEAEERDESKE